MTERRKDERRKRPASQFYWGDWLRSTDLRSLSLEARGLWIDLLCLMHEGEPYGHLAVNGRGLACDTVARMTGVSLGRFKKLLQEIEDAGVSSRSEGGMLYSRRMVKDEAIREARAAGGQLGGNPNLTSKPKDRPKVEDKVNHPPNINPTPAVAVAVASANQPQQRQRGDRFTMLLDRFPLTGGSRIAITEFLEGLPNGQSADAWIARMLGYLDGLDMPNGRPATPEAIVTACRDWNPKGGYSPVGFRAFIERAMLPSKPAAGGAPSWRPTEVQEV